MVKQDEINKRADSVLFMFTISESLKFRIEVLQECLRRLEVEKAKATEKTGE